MTTPILQSSKTKPSFADRVSATMQTLHHSPVNASLSDARPVGSTFSVSGVSVALKCPTTSRMNVCVELLHSTLDGTWLPSWGLTNRSDCYLWMLPEGEHLWVTRASLRAYLLHEWELLPLTNHSPATRQRLWQQGKPADVVTTWVPISTLVDECDTLCYSVDCYNPQELHAWLRIHFL